MSYVAARNAVLTDQTGNYLDDRVGYTPTMLGCVKITHAAPDRIGIRLGVGSTSSPLGPRTSGPGATRRPTARSPTATSSST
jgi:hypothetical protein